MPVNYKYNPVKNALYGNMEGKISLDELKEALDQITNSKEFSPDVKAIWDLRKLDFTSLNTEFGEQLVSIRSLRPERGETKIAIVAEHDLGFGLNRMYGALSEKLAQKVMAFRDYDEAEAWLLNENESR